MHDARIPAPQARDEILTRERCYITEVLNDERVPQVSLARCRVPPGVTTELHSLSVAEWYVISSGHGRMTVGDTAPFDVGPGDSVAIPAHAAQCIENSGAGDLVFQCICMPRFEPGCYRPLEDR